MASEMEATTRAPTAGEPTSHLEAIWPAAGRLRLPLSRDQLMLLMAATNEIFLGVDIFLAHSISGTIVPNEWIPIIFGPAAGVLLIFAGFVAARRRSLATVVANLVFLGSIAVGLLGAYFHIVRAALPSAAAGQQLSILMLVWAPPVLGPLTFSLVGVIGISAAWIESPPNSGTLVFLKGRRLRLPYTKTQAYFFMVSLGVLATLISSVFDHARVSFENPWLWFPIAAGIFATVVSAVIGAVDRPSRIDLVTYAAAMVLLIIVGVVGLLLHVDTNLIAGGQFVSERFIRGSPVMAPLLFADMGAIGLIVLLDPREKRKEE